MHQRMHREPERRFLLTGSSACSLHRAGVNLLGGRAGRRIMSPFLAVELGEAFSLQVAQRIGMLPVIWTAESAEQALADYATVAVPDEVRAEARVRQLDRFARALEPLAVTHGSVLSPTATSQLADVSARISLQFAPELPVGLIYVLDVDLFMTLAAFARLVDTTPKWVLNTLRALGRSQRYRVDLARQLAVTREIAESFGLPLSTAYSLAKQALRQPVVAESLIALQAQPDSNVELRIDLYRMLSAFSVRLAALRGSGEPRLRGRPRTKAIDPIEAAEAWGLDLSLIRENLRKTPAERLRRLDAMLAFATRVRRVTAPF